MPTKRLRAALAVIVCTLLLGLPAHAQAPSGAPAGPPPVPVTVAAVTKQDVPVQLRAIGTVQAYQTVLVRARVDGTLDGVFFTEGQRVKPGDLLAQLDPRPYQAALDQAVAKRASNEAMVTNARQELARYNELARDQIASRQKLDQTRSALAQAEASIRGDDATIAAAQLNLGFTRITSPIQGRVGLRLTDAGNFIRVADPGTTGIVSIAQIQPISVLFTLPQDVLPRVQVAMKAGKLPVMAYSADGKTLLSQGELLTMDSAIDAATGTIRLKSVFANADDALWPGQFVNVRMRLDTLKDVPTIPSAAVQRGPNGLYAYVLKPDNTVALQPIEIEQDDGQVAVVGKGLQGGESVVVAGQSRLANGSRVTAKPPAPAS